MRYALLSSTLVAGLVACAAAVAVPIAFVQSDGSDANTRHGCTSIKPCRTFAAALTVTDAGGEIVARDSEDYGAVTIDKSVSLTGTPGAGIVVASGNAVNVATFGVDVVLRGLAIRGAGHVGNGISMTAGRALTMENCIVADFSGQGVLVDTAAAVRIVDSVLRNNANGARIQGGASADIVKTRFMGNGGAGLLVAANTAGATSASVSDSTASGNLAGFDVSASHPAGIGRMAVTRSMASHNRQAGFLAAASAGNAVMTVGDSTAIHNAIGLAHFPGVAGFAAFETLGNNMVRQNGTAAVGLIVPVAPM